MNSILKSTTALWAAALPLVSLAGSAPAPVPANTSLAMPALDAAGEGRRVFLKLNCYGCHGMFAAGGMAPNIIGAEHGDVSEAVMQGEDSGMPSFKAYATSTDIDNLTTYLNSIGKPGEPVFMDWWKKVPKK